MKKKCPNCRLVNYATAEKCLRCAFDLVEISTFGGTETQKSSLGRTILKRAIVCLSVLLFILGGFYLSLIGSAKHLEYEQKKTIERSIRILEQKGFAREAFILNYLTAYRATDNWLNASVEKENAYAATNFPFEIMTVYPDFFTYTKDDTERAAILLHEAQHLQGADEKEAYEYVWRNRKKLGWTEELYGNSMIWRHVRKQTKEYSPNLFICEGAELADCTE